MKLYAILASAIGLAAVVAGTALAAAPVPCAGTVSIAPTAVPAIRTANGNTFVEFDFAGRHELCLANGSQVTGAVAGHLVQRISADGDLTIRFDEVLAYDGGTLSYRGGGSLSNGKWQSYVQTVGAGTGPLAGIHGRGEFFPTANPTLFIDVIDYVYAP